MGRRLFPKAIVFTRGGDFKTRGERGGGGCRFGAIRGGETGLGLPGWFASALLVSRAATWSSLQPSVVTAGAPPPKGVDEKVPGGHGVAGRLGVGSRRLTSSPRRALFLIFLPLFRCLFLIFMWIYIYKLCL